MSVYSSIINPIRLVTEINLSFFFVFLSLPVYIYKITFQLFTLPLPVESAHTYIVLYVFKLI